MDDRKSICISDSISAHETSISKLDVLSLKLAIIQSKRDLDIYQNKLKEKQKKYENFVPKKDFLVLKEKYEKIKSNIAESKEKFLILKQNLTETYNKCVNLNNQKNLLENSLNKAKRSRTPRPNWKFYSQYFINFDTNELNLIENLQSEYLSTEEKINLISDKFYSNSLFKKKNLENIKFTNVMKHSNFRCFKKENLKKIKQIIFSNRDFFVISENLIYKKILQDNVNKKISKMADFLYKHSTNFPNQTELSLFDSISWCLSLIYKAQDTSMPKYVSFLGQLINESIDLNLFVQFKKIVLKLYFQFEMILNIECDSERKNTYEFLNNFLSDEKAAIPEKFDFYFELEEESEIFYVNFDQLEKVLMICLDFMTSDDLLRLKLLAMNDVENYKKTNENTSKLFDFRILFIQSHYGKLSMFLDQILDHIIKKNKQNE